MTHTLRFGQFAWGELQAQARASGSTELDLVRSAIAELAERIAAGDRGPATTVPDLSEDRPSFERVDIELDREAEDALAGEARRQGIELVRLLEYAVLAHLASHSPD